jgi:hypothetical protein
MNQTKTMSMCTTVNVALSVKLEPVLVRGTMKSELKEMPLTNKSIDDLLFSSRSLRRPYKPL